MLEFLNQIGLHAEPQFWISGFQIIWINVLLSGDNAIVIALACRTLPPRQRLYGMVLGTAVALAMRLVFAGVVSSLMLLPLVKIVGGLALLWIAVKLLLPSESTNDVTHSSTSLWRAIRLIAVADIVMSLDNVIAVAAAAGGSLGLLVFGLGISIPLIVAGANVIMTMLTYFPVIIWGGAGLLGWIAGDMLAGDPLIVDFGASFGPAVPEKIRLVCAALGMAGVVVTSLIARSRMRAAQIDA